MLSGGRSRLLTAGDQKACDFNKFSNSIVSELGNFSSFIDDCWRYCGQNQLVETPKALCSKNHQQEVNWLHKPNLLPFTVRQTQLPQLKSQQKSSQQAKLKRQCEKSFQLEFHSGFHLFGVAENVCQEIDGSKRRRSRTRWYRFEKTVTAYGSWKSIKEDVTDGSRSPSLSTIIRISLGINLFLVQFLAFSFTFSSHDRNKLWPCTNETRFLLSYIKSIRYPEKKYFLVETEKKVFVATAQQPKSTKLLNLFQQYLYVRGRRGKAKHSCICKIWKFRNWKKKVS